MDADWVTAETAGWNVPVQGREHFVFSGCLSASQWGMQALGSVMQNPNEVPVHRQRGWLGRIILMISFWSNMFVRSYKAGRRRPVGIVLSRPVHKLSGPLVLLCVMEGECVLKDRAVGVLDETGTLCALPHCTLLVLSLGKKRTCFWCFPVCLPLWEAECGYFLQLYSTFFRISIYLLRSYVHSLHNNPEAEAGFQLLCVG